MSLTIDNKTVDGFREALYSAKNIVVVSHMNPDGDAVGSALAVRCFLRESFSSDNNVAVILPHPPPSDSHYLPGADSIVNAKEDFDLCQRLMGGADLIFCVDFNNASRIAPLDVELHESKAVKLLVDHHHSPELALFDHIVSVPDLSSTCELLYWLFVQLSGSDSIGLDTARCLFHGISTDTGCFSYACEDPTLYEAVAGIMKQPVHAADVHCAVTNNYSVAKMRILGYVLSNKLKIFEEDRFAYIYINEEELHALGGIAEDLEGLVNYTLLMKNIFVGAMVKQTDGKTRISFRSRCDYDVNAFAKKYFGGGGHAKASGATSSYTFEDTVVRLEKCMLDELRKNVNRHEA